ncbi:ribosome-binding factor A [Patescibacteria group bacterium]|nr:ribosome-binding factor A [Patescibacteria group bacterium]MBU1673733.1 ribosome-binding factor A [Patescibacteria group bacterium]MBU1963100.1 ribosome-binding factor A [Patescibacteria group bacterium]
MSKRTRQVNELLLQNIGKIVNEEMELPPDFLLTFTKVDTAPDLKTAKVFYSVVPSTKGEAGEKFMENNSYVIQKSIGKYITSKFTPKLSFKHDTQEDKAEHIEKLLDNINNKG